MCDWSYLQTVENAPGQASFLLHCIVNGVGRIALSWASRECSHVYIGASYLQYIIDLLQKAPPLATLCRDIVDDDSKTRLHIPKAK
jgi:hypothetical protein